MDLVDGRISLLLSDLLYSPVIQSQRIYSSIHCSIKSFPLFMIKSSLKRNESSTLCLPWIFSTRRWFNHAQIIFASSSVSLGSFMWSIIEINLCSIFYGVLQHRPQITSLVYLCLSNLVFDWIRMCLVRDVYLTLRCYQSLHHKLLRS